MVVVKVELWPHGDESKAHEIGRMEIVNDGTGNHAVSNYDVELKHAGTYVGSAGYFKRAQIKGFRRTKSPYNLIAMAQGAALGRFREDLRPNPLEGRPRHH